VWVLLVAAVGRPGYGRPIRIVDGTPRPRPTQIPSPTPIKPIPARDPAPANGPDVMEPLDGVCVDLDKDGYVYSLCPFHNFTQREQTAPNAWTRPFWGMLGVYSGMAVRGTGAEREFTGMSFTDGDKCGSTPRTATVSIACKEMVEGEGGNVQCELSEVGEPETCVYSAVLSCRAFCGADLAVPPLWDPSAPPKATAAPVRSEPEAASVLPVPSASGASPARSPPPAPSPSRSPPGSPPAARTASPLRQPLLQSARASVEAVPSAPAAAAAGGSTPPAAVAAAATEADAGATAAGGTSGAATAPPAPADPEGASQVVVDAAAGGSVLGLLAPLTGGACSRLPRPSAVEALVRAAEAVAAAGAPDPGEECSTAEATEHALAALRLWHSAVTRAALGREP